MNKILEEINHYRVDSIDVNKVKKSIEEKGYWEEKYEWRISTVIISRIEPKSKNGINYYEVKVECEQKTVLPAITIEKAVLFVKIHKDFQMEMFYSFDWGMKPNIGFSK